MALVNNIEQYYISKTINELRESIDFLDRSISDLKREVLGFEGAKRAVDIERSILTLEQTTNELRTIVSELAKTVSTLDLGSNIQRLEQIMNELTENLMTLPRTTGSLNMDPALKYIEQVIFDLKTEMRKNDNQRHAEYLNLNEAIQVLTNSVNTRFSDLDKSIGGKFNTLYRWMLCALLAILIAVLKIMP